MSEEWKWCWVEWRDERGNPIGQTVILPGVPNDAPLRPRHARQAARLLGRAPVMPGGRETEKVLHERFSHLRLNREWFEPTDELLAFIEDVKSPVFR